MNYDPTLQVPPEIIEAARKVAEWAEMNGAGDYWEIGPVCSRNFATRLHAWWPQVFPWRYTEDWKPLAPGDPGYDTAIYETVALKEISGTTPPK